MAKHRSTGNKLAIAVGLLLVFIPDPTTTAAGLAITAGAFALG